ncbi:MAG: hypothetical protein NTX61_03410 [Bacteroidetes bacterium]|nr:hypothetical protein [Bacteroidota bacterium]
MNIEEHNTPVVDNAINETVKELLNQNKTGTIETERLGFLLNYFIDSGSIEPLKYLRIDTKDILPNRSNYTDTELHMESGKDNRPEDILCNEMVRALRNKKIYRRTYYRKVYQGLKDTEIHKGWIDLLTEIYEDDKALNEIFVRLVEEQRKVTITSAKALQDITGIIRLGFDKNNEKEEARRQMGHVFTSAMRYRYEKALEEMLDGGEKYNDLLNTTPAKFNIPDSHKEDAIEEAVYNSFELGDTSTIIPNIVDVAKTIGAPFELVLRSSQRYTI